MTMAIPGVGAPTGISLKPSEAVQGGLIDQANLLVKQARFVNWDYGHPERGIFALALKLTLVADDDVEYEQYYSAGDIQRFQPSNDGTELIAMGAATNLNENTNMVFMFKNLVAAGFPEDRIDSKCTFLEGLYAFWRRVAPPARTGLADNRQNTQRDQTVLVPTQIENMPWEPSKRGTPAMANRAAPGTTAAPAPALIVPPTGVVAVPPAAAPVASADGIATEAAAYLTGKLAQPPFAISKTDLASAAFQDLNTNPNRGPLVQWLWEDANLLALAAQGTIGYDGATITRAG